MRLFTNAAVIATFVGALAFVGMYAYMTRGGWRGSSMGRHVMVFMTVITIVSSLAVISIFFGNVWPAREFVRGAAWSSVAACIWWRVVLLRRAQKHPHYEGDEHGS